MLKSLDKFVRKLFSPTAYVATIVAGQVVIMMLVLWTFVAFLGYIGVIMDCPPSEIYTTPMALAFLGSVVFGVFGLMFGIILKELKDSFDRTVQQARYIRDDLVKTSTKEPTKAGKGTPNTSAGIR